MANLLVVDDEPSICWGLEQIGKRLGHKVVAVPRAETGLEAIGREGFDLTLLDVRLPGMSGLDALPRFRQASPKTPVVVMTAFGDLETAVEAVRRGAVEYLVKPFDTQRVVDLLARLLRPREPSPGAIATDESTADGLVGRTAVMQEVFRRIALAAATDACVLVSGESGTGKELVARAIHRYSARADKPFVATNLAALNPTLAESELFGHVRGAFTGADSHRSGLLAQADGGTLFLDEIADVPASIQVKLLRALEHAEVTPVGSNQSVPTRFRLVTATHRDLPRLVRAGEFRHDLYFRLGTFQIETPPLRERRDDIPLLIEHFARRRTPTPTFSKEALQVAVERPWRGNVRELRNAVEHALVVARDGHVHPEHWPAAAPWLTEPSDDALSPDEADAKVATLLGAWTDRQLASDADIADLYERLLRLVEPPVFERALAKHKGQCAAAARVLGLHRTTLRKRLDQYGIGAEE